MDTDFVNKYIQRQSQLITELTNKNLMVEVKYQILEEQYGQLLVQHQALSEAVEQAKVAAEQQQAAEGFENKGRKRSTPIKKPSESDFVEEQQQPESQF